MDSWLTSTPSESEWPEGSFKSHSIINVLGDVLEVLYSKFEENISWFKNIHKFNVNFGLNTMGGSVLM